MKRAVSVHLGNAATRVGSLSHEAQGAREMSSFEYDPSWLGNANAFAVDPELRLVSGRQFHQRTSNGSVFHGAIADSLPDGWGKRIILRDHAKRRDEARRGGAPVDHRALDELDYLLAVDDLSRVGALRFQHDGEFRRASEPGRRTTPPLIELRQLIASSHAVENNTETAADLAYLRGRGTSLGGLRPKCSVVEEDGHLAIGKFPSVLDDRAVTKGEVLALRLAARAGVVAAEARVVDADGNPVALVRRFDRRPDGERIPYVSAATLLGVDPRDAHEHSYTEIVDAIRVHGAAPQADIEQLWRRIVYFVLITNVDDHLMNHGFLYDGDGRWRLAPAFDVNPFPERARELKTWISEDTGPAARLDAALEVAPYFRITKKRATEIVAEVEGAVRTWRDEARAVGMADAEASAFEPAFEHEERLVAAARIR